MAVSAAADGGRYIRGPVSAVTVSRRDDGRGDGVAAPCGRGAGIPPVRTNASHRAGDRPTVRPGHVAGGSLAGSVVTRLRDCCWSIHQAGFAR